MTDSAGLLKALRDRFTDLWNSAAWSGQVELVALAETGLTIRVASRFVRDWVRENYLTAIQAEVCSLVGHQVPIVFSVAESSPPPVTTPEPPPTRPPAQEILNPKYTFESFVVGPSNQFAHAASLAVSGQPGRTYNPLFIYGGVGLGKTHLLNAIGNKIRERKPGARVIALSSEKFVNELIHCIRFDKMREFRRKYRDGCDALLMDDVQFIAGKDRSQEEFFHTFNHLHESRSQIVLTSDNVPREIAGLEQRLRSRFEWGLLADIQVPDLETRIAIVSKKAEEDGIALDSEVALFLATHMKSNIRELEGALIRVNAFASLAKVPISVPFAKEVLKNVLGGVGRQITVEQIQKLVAEYFQIRIADLTGKRRMRSLAVPRQIAMYLCRKHVVGASFPEIGTKFGGKDHSTVIHAVGKIGRKVDEDTTLKDQILALEHRLTA